MSRDIKRFLYICLGIFIFVLVAKLFFWMLPYLIIGGVLIYLITKIVGFFSKGKKTSQSKTYTYSSSTTSDNTYSEVEEDVVDTSCAIDVDYEDVDK